MDTQMDVDDTGKAEGNPVHACLLRLNTCDLQMTPAAAAVATGPMARQLEEHRRGENEAVISEEEKQRQAAEAAARKKAADIRCRFKV